MTIFVAFYDKVRRPYIYSRNCIFVCICVLSTDSCFLKILYNVIKQSLYLSVSHKCPYTNNLVLLIFIYVFVIVLFGSKCVKLKFEIPVRI